MLQQKKLKLSNYYSDALKASYHFKQKNWDEARQFYRKSGEAFMKYRLYDRGDETKVCNYLAGSHELDGTPLKRKWQPNYSALLDTLSSSNYISQDELQALKTIKEDGNLGMHDSDVVPDRIETEASIKLVHACSRKLTVSFYKSIHKDIPSKLTDAYEGKVNADVLEEHFDFGEVLEAADNFNNRNQYILISPPNDKNTSVDLKSSLARIPWSFILDFDPNTKGQYGLFTAFGAAKDSRVVPLVIDQYESHISLPISTSGGRLNWLFANGLSESVGTSCSDFRSWNKRKYGKFIKEALRRFMTDSTNEYYIVCLNVEDRYLKDIIHSIDDIEEVEADLVHFIFVSTDEDYLGGVSEEAQDYSFNSASFKMSANEFILGVEETMSSAASVPLSSVIVPSRVSGKLDCIDISSIVSTLKDGGLYVVHASIGATAPNDLSPSDTFFRGEDISWNDISKGVEATRKIQDALKNKIKDRIQLRQSSKFLLYHDAGAGGTTLSRRLAYDLRKEYPVVLLNKYIKGVTEEKLHLFYNRVKIPVLAIVEASKVNITTIDALIRNCNSNKARFLFVIVERHNKKIGLFDQQNNIHLSDTMADSDEKNRFVNKVTHYAKNKSDMAEWDKKSPNQCEVIDFSLAICNDDFKQEKIEQYVSYYNRFLSPSLNEFVLYVSMIYHYSQKEVPDLIFRNLFKKDGVVIGLQKYLRNHPTEEKALYKILSNVTDEAGKQTLWRPRYARFADAVLQSVCSVGGWKEMVYESSINLINSIKSNQQYLVDDSRQILISVFLERGKEELLGVEEAWSKDNNTHFSQLLEDLGYSELNQRNVLSRLANSFPNEAHFWGHLARFCYEKASIPKHFDEAMSFVQKAFEAHGETDFNLQHIAGMCKRRLLEYYKRENVELGFQDIKDLTEEARGYFKESRRLNSKNIYAYISEIQLIVILIEYGKRWSPYDTYRRFLFSRENEWYQEQYVSMLELIDETKILLSQMKTLGNTQKTHKSFDYLNRSESQSKNFIDDLPGMLNHLSAAIEKALYEERPRLRQLYVRYLLLSKVKGDPKRLGESWGLLTEKEQDKVENYLNSNIQQGNTNLFSLRYWFQFVRKCRKDTPVDEIISRLQTLAQASGEHHPIVQLEANYNILVLKAFTIIHDKDYFDTDKIREIRYLASTCHQQSLNDKYIFDLLVNDHDISGIVPYNENTDFSNCIRLHGTISSIRSTTQGEIKLDCGLTAFFAPSKGNFVEGRDETKEVTFVIGFRHDGLFALEVKAVDDSDDVKTSDVSEELKEENAIENIDNLSVETSAASGERDDVYEIPSGNQQKFKILGKIKL